MSLLSTKGVYGLSAIYELFVARDKKTPMPIKEIALKANIPQNYLEQLLIILRQAGFVKSIRGAYGGYVLAKDPKEILIKDILVALEGNLLISDVSVRNPTLSLFYEENNAKIQALFEESLADFDTYTQRLSNELYYSI